jgi:SAM-dependent methyltransferase
VVKRIDPAVMARLASELGAPDTPIVYHDRHCLVRELFWRSHESLIALSRPPARRRVLDFGGGNGVLLPTLSPLFDEVVCVDLHAAMAREVVRLFNLGNVEVVEEDIFRLALPSAHFDSVVAASVLEHVEDLPPLAAEIARVLVPGGELLVNVPSENRFYELGRRVFRYTKPADHFHDSGYAIEAVRSHLRLDKKRQFPLNFAPLSVFCLLRFVR